MKETKEIWVPAQYIDDAGTMTTFPGYQVSNLGRVMSLNYLNTKKPGIMSPYPDKKGYLHIKFNKNNNGDFALTAADTVSTNSATLNGHINILSVIEDFTFDIAPDIVGYDTPTAFGVNIVGPSDAQYDLEWSIEGGDRYNRVTIEKDGLIGAVANIESQYFPKYDDDITIKVRDKVSGIEKTVTVHAKTEARLVIEGPTEINESGFYQYHAYMKYMSQGVEKTWGKEEQIYLAEYYDGISIGTSTKTINRMTVAEGAEIDQEVILRSETGRVSAIPTLEPYVAEPYIVQVDTMTSLGITNIDTEDVEVSFAYDRLTNAQSRLSGYTVWTPFTSTVLHPGETMYIKADHCDKAEGGSRRGFYFYRLDGSTPGKVSVSGNVMSLCGGGLEMGTNSLDCLFRFAQGLTTAPELPATQLSDGCYEDMFEGCYSLTSAPELPATQLAAACYSGMFRGCTSLVSAPLELPATEPKRACYSNMFYGCKGLMTTPEIHLLSTSSERCLQYMFYGCDALISVKIHSEDWYSENAELWLSKTWPTSPTGTFYKPASTTIPSGPSGIPAGWTVVNI